MQMNLAPLAAPKVHIVMQERFVPAIHTIFFLHLGVMRNAFGTIILIVPPFHAARKSTFNALRIIHTVLLGSAPGLVPTLRQ